MSERDKTGAAGRIRFYERTGPTAEQAEDLDTARLVTRIQAGDKEGFTELYERYFQRIYGYLRVLLRDPHEAEDAAQQVFLDAFQGLAGYERREQPFRAWLFTVARNQAVKRMRRSSRQELRSGDRLERDREQLGIEENGAGEMRSLGWITDGDLLVFIDRLPFAQRQVLALRYLFGFSTAEIASVLDRTPEAVRMQQSRALSFLRARLTAIGRAPVRRGREPSRGIFRQAKVVRIRRFSLSAPGPTA